jgi:transcription factor IIIB subunit 2
MSTRNVTFDPELGGGKQEEEEEEIVSQEPAENSLQLVATPHRDRRGQDGMPNYTSSSLICPDCGSREIEQHDASGASICTECGVVVEENAIVSAVEFVEGAGGASSMVGQFVSATSSKAYTGGTGPGGGGLRGARFGFSRDSRETTLANGRRRIQEIASRLRLGSHYVDAAHRLFTIAVEKNFVQGRRTTHVVAACLYIACRQEKSQHMLIDFSDALQVNVYVLGTCFLKFRRLLGLKLEIIDPALYVYRFAAHLDLDEKANAVALTALRLVGRMKRDWIVAGRRPAGICAAALLIAARAHGFSRHQTDVTKILRVCGFTVASRVREFELTPSANLTLEQFNTVDLESEADPPAFSRNRIREARARAIQEGNVALLTSGALDDPAEGKKAGTWRSQTRKNQRKEEHNKLYESLQKDLAVEKTKTLEDSTEGNEIVLHTGTDSKTAVATPGWEKAYPRKRDGRAIILPELATEEEMRESTVPVEAKLNLSEWKDSMPASMEDDIDDMFRNEEEELEREAIFNKINKEYIENQERKESDRLNAETARFDQEKDDVAQAEGHARYKSTRSRSKRKRDDGDAAGAQTTEEKLLAAVASRKISRKINYDALSSIFDDDGNLGSVPNESDANAAGEDAMYEML